jgi:hypothetical protein
MPSWMLVGPFHGMVIGGMERNIARAAVVSAGADQGALRI